MGIKCATCGKFISYKEIETHEAKLHYDSDFDGDHPWYECKKCTYKWDHREECLKSSKPLIIKSNI